MTDEAYPEDVLYHPEHDWARLHGDTEATFGITWFAQDQLGEIVFWDAPRVGAVLRQGETYTEVESVKAVSDVVAPLSGEVLAVNDALAAQTDLLNCDPYGEGWMVRVRLGDAGEQAALLDAATYRRLLGQGA